MSGKKLIIAAVLAFIGMNLTADENDFTFKPLFGGGRNRFIFPSKRFNIF